MAEGSRAFNVRVAVPTGEVDRLRARFAPRTNGLLSPTTSGSKSRFCDVSGQVVRHVVALELGNF